MLKLTILALSLFAATNNAHALECDDARLATDAVLEAVKLSNPEAACVLIDDKAKTTDAGIRHTLTLDCGSFKRQYRVLVDDTNRDVQCSAGNARIHDED